MTKRVNSHTYGLSVNSPQALKVCGCGQSPAGTSTAVVRVRPRDRASESPRLQRSSAAQARALPASWPRPLQPSGGGPINCGECVGLVLSTATKFKIGRSGPELVAA